MTLPEASVVSFPPLPYDEQTSLGSARAATAVCPDAYRLVVVALVATKLVVVALVKVADW
jgi:hypothetical protein